MAVQTGTRLYKAAQYLYDFASDGGAISTIALKAEKGEGIIPAASYVLGGFLEVLAGFTTGTAAVAGIQVEAANDTVNSTIVSGAPYSTTGFKAIIPVYTVATMLKTTADRSPSIVIATGTITAGKARLVLFYY